MSRLRPEIHPLLCENVVRALQGSRVYTVLDFIKADIHQIIKIARLNFREVLAVKNYLLKKFSAVPVNGFDFYKHTLNNTAIVPTGIKGVDQLLNGGLFTGNIYELCGLPASGKTHFVLSLIRNVVLSTQQQVYVFDTKNDFSGTKMKRMLNDCNENQQMQCLDKIIVNRCYTKFDLINNLYEIKNNLEDNLKLRLIIIDSLPASLFSSNENIRSNSYLNHIINIMRYISSEHHIAFLIINLIKTWSDYNFNQSRASESITCGKYWFKVPNTRLKIEKIEEKNSCKISVLSSDILKNQLNRSVDIVLTDNGFL